MTGRTWSDTDKEALLRLHRSGMTYDEIAAEAWRDGVNKSLNRYEWATGALLDLRRAGFVEKGEWVRGAYVHSITDAGRSALKDTAKCG